MINTNSLTNLQKGKRFGDGQPVDRGGAPKGKRLSTLLRELGEQDIAFMDVDGIMRDMPVKKAIAVALLAKALGGDVQALKLVGSFYMADEPFEPKQKTVIDATMYKMMEDMGLNAKGLTQQPNIIVLNS